MTGDEMDAAEKRVEESRAELDRDLDRLGDQLAPANLAAAAVDAIDPFERLKQAARHAKSRPLLAVLLGGIVGLIAFRRWQKGSSHKS